MSDEDTKLGSRWWKFDFHTHTPMSGDYGRDNYSLKDINEEEWLQKAMEANLDCVAVTDHNSGKWIDALKAKNQELKESTIKPLWYRDLTIFPGVEISVADSSNRVHLLAIFDPSFRGENITGVLGACGITDGYGDEQKTSTNGIDFIGVVKKIGTLGGVVIPAHIDGLKGLLHEKTSLNQELAKSLKDIIAAEFCDLNKFEKSDVSLKKVVNKLAKVAGSDAHTPDEIGRYSSWLKMSTQTINGLKLALMDHEYCVKNQDDNPNINPNIYLSELTISKMQHCGRIQAKPFCLHFHPHFNTFIGGRGTGKSTVLESIRIASGRVNDLKNEAPRIKQNLEDFMELATKNGVMLPDTKITLIIHRRRDVFKLCWQKEGKPFILQKKIDGNWIDQEEGNLKERFPINIYSQKQINELSSNTRGLLELVDRTQNVNQTEWKSRWNIKQSEFIQLREQKRRLESQLSEEQSICIKLNDIKNDLKQYEEHGHGEILRQYQKISQQMNSIPRKGLFDNLSEHILDVAKMIEFPVFPNQYFEQDEYCSELRDIHENTELELNECKKSLIKISEDIKKIQSIRAERIINSKWYNSYKLIINEYGLLVKEYEKKKNQLSLSVYGEWVKQRDSLQYQLEVIETIKKQKDEVEKKIENKIEELMGMRNELFKKRCDFIQDVIGENEFVRMEVIQFGDVSTLESDYRQILSLEGEKFKSSILDNENSQGILWKVFNSTISDKVQKGFLSKISDIKGKSFQIAIGNDFNYSRAFINRLSVLYDNKPSSFDFLDTWWPEDLLLVKFSKDPSSAKFENLDRGSAGEKAAAILAFLLSYGSMPLIIDQPEDDLDNALINDLIVRQIHSNKIHRQLIIATHNPNIVVNGDAELVDVFKFKNGQINLDLQGGIEEQNIRDAICKIMEGGREAFDKRYKRITLKP